MQLSPGLRRLAKDLESGLPAPVGRPIHVRFLPNLHAHRGRLLSRPIGQPIHAACDLRKRDIVLDSGLRSQPGELRRILAHELFHFAWVCLGNPGRRSYAQLIDNEWARRARGELGWSAQYRKDELRHTPVSDRNPRHWRDYVCESFCDTGAWLYSGIPSHAEFTLAGRFTKIRAAWFQEYFRGRRLSI